MTGISAAAGSRNESGNDGAPRPALAWSEAIDDCRKNGIMKTYLAKHSAEVRNMLITEFDVDEYIQVSKEEGREEGIEIGLEKGRKQTARAMKDSGISIELIVKCTGLLEEEIQKL
jgi:predicted transposase/invertase (TIGR01784 family)